MNLRQKYKKCKQELERLKRMTITPMCIQSTSFSRYKYSRRLDISQYRYTTGTMDDELISKIMESNFREELAHETAKLVQDNACIEQRYMGFGYVEFSSEIGIKW